MKINGNLLFDGTGEIQNLRVEKLAHTAVPAAAAGDVGRVIYVTSAGTTAAGIFLANSLYQGNPDGSGGYQWRAVSGNVQEEVDAIEASLGSMVNADGTFNAAAFTTANSSIWTTGPTSLMNALDVLSDFATGKDTLEEIEPVGATGNIIYADSGTTWAQAAPGATSGVQPYDTELAALATVSSAADALPYFTGSGTATTTTLTSFGRTLIDDVDATGARATLNLVIGTDVQAFDSGLASLASLTGPGLVALDASGNVMSARSLVAPAAGFTISNADGSGNPTFVLANDLSAYEGLASTGIVVRTGDGTATTRAITESNGRTVVTNGDGVASAPTVDLATVTQATGGTFLKVTIDSYGRVTQNEAVTTGDITALVDATYVNVSGDTMAGTLNMGGNQITGLATPTGDSHAATKAYVDSLTTGLSWKNAVRAATTANITLSGLQTVDGVSLAAGDRVLVKDQTAAAENGIYVVVDGGSWTRAGDMSDSVEFDGAAVYVKEGTQWESTGWTQTATITTVGTTPVAWSQFSGANLYTWGTGLLASGNTININLGAGISELPTDEVGIDLYAPTGGGLMLTENGSASSTGAAAKLHLKLKASGGLTQDGDGLYVPAAGVTNAMLANSTITGDAEAGSGTLALGETLNIVGSSVQGLGTSVASTGGVMTFTLTPVDASTSQKGVSSFDGNDFSVTGGVVSIKTSGVGNAQLENSAVSLAGDTGTGSVSLGGTITLDGQGAMSVNATGSTFQVSVATAGTGNVGVASFAAADFTVSGGGEVAVVAKGLDSLTDVAVSSATGGQTLVHNGTEFVNRKVYHNHTQSSAASTWTVTHNLGQKFCNVTVYDGSDQVIIPNTITFTSSSALEVTFTTSITGGVVVMGVNAGA